jgi:hypothetical protein
VGAATCDKDGMDEKVAKCLGGLEAKVGEKMMMMLQRGIYRKIIFAGFCKGSLVADAKMLAFPQTLENNQAKRKFE